MSNSTSTSTTVHQTGLLVSLAMLRQDWDQGGRSWLDNFEPFVGDCLRQVTQPGVSDVEIQERVSERFGIKLPSAALSTILGRMTRAGDCTRAHRRYCPTQQLRGREPLDRPRQRCEREHQALIARLVMFARSEFKVEWTDAQADQSLQLFVEDWSWALELMRAELSGSSTPLRLVNERERQYVVASFVAGLRERDPDQFDWFMGVIRGAMLAASLYLDPGAAAQTFDDAAVYLDTPLLMDLLTGDEETSAAARELIELADGMGLRFACFQHTASELRGVLEATAQGRRRAKEVGGPRPGVRVLRRGLSASDLEAIAADLPHRLGEYGIAIERKPHWLGQPTTNETALERHLEKYVSGQQDHTRRCDVESLVGVHRLRKGAQPPRFEAAKAFFVTTNHALVKASGIHFGTRGDPHGVPIAMTEQAFGTLLWLKRPTARPDLPWKRVLADCRAALNPSDALWQSYLDEVDRLQERGKIDEHTYYVARYASESRRALMDTTRGNQRRLTDQTVAEILEEARRAIAGPGEEEATRLRRQAADTQRLLALKDRDLIRAREQIERTREEGASQTAQVGDDRFTEGLELGQARSSDRIASAIVRGVGAFVGLVFAVLTLVLGALNMLSIPEPWAWVVGLVFLGFTVASAWLSAFGGTVRERVEARVRGPVSRWVAGHAVAGED